MGVPTGGANLGQARGSIVIDTSSVKNAQREVQQASQMMNRALGALGVGVGVSQFARFAVEATNVATAYKRQEVAALALAGSQEKLNQLLDVYRAATGGAVDDAQALADVTRLQAIGFADSAEELDKFAKAARGISVATGQSQEYIIGQLQLAIANQSTLRLDQLGLGVSEVKRRVDELKASNKNLTDEMAYQQAILEAANEKFGALADSAVGQKTEVEKLEVAWKNLRLEVGKAVEGNVNEVSSGINFILDAIRARIKETNDLIDEYEATARAPFASRTSIGRVTPTRIDTGDAPIDIRARNEAIVEWVQGIQDIERQANQQRLDATRQYEEQRTSAIREYGKTIAREAEDFARSRARAEADYAKSIADVREAASRRELRMAEDLARSIGQARADSAERLADMQEQLDRTLATRRSDSAERIAGWEEDRSENIAERRKQSTERLLSLEENFTRERERAMRDSRERLHQAAGQFDAIAINQEQRRFAREQEERRLAHNEQLTTEQEKLAEAVAQLDAAHGKRLEDERRSLDKSIRQAQEAYDRQVADEKEALDKRIRQANEAYQLQLEDAREADALRLEDMAADFAERKRREDEDRRTRLTRMAQDHADQLAEMARQHTLRLEQISEQAAEERRQLDDEFEKELDALGIRTDAWTEKQKQITDYAIKEFDRWWARISEIANGLAAIGPQPLNPMITPGGWPSLTNPGTTPAPVAGGASVTIAPGAIQVFAATGQNPMDIAGAVRTQIEQLLKQWMGPYQQ